MLSPLSPLKPTASFTNDEIFSLSSSLIGSETIPSGVSMILFLLIQQF